MKDRYFKFTDGIYCKVVHCYFGDKVKGAKKARKIFPTAQLTDNYFEDFRGCVISHSNDVFLWMPAKPKSPSDFNTFAHECFHVTSTILDACDVEYHKEDANEVFAYHIGYVTEQILSKL